MYAEASVITAGSGDVVFTVGPVPVGAKFDGFTFWSDQTDALVADAGLGTEADMFLLSAGTNDRPARDANEFSAANPVFSSLPLQSLGSPLQVYLRVSRRVKTHRYLVIRLRANNGGAAPFRFGAAVDFSMGASVLQQGLSGKGPSFIESGA